MTDPDVLNDLSFSKSFWCSWPTKIDYDVDNMNSTILKEKNSRKDRCQRAIRKLTKSEHAAFTSLMIGDVVYSDNGEKL